MNIQEIEIWKDIIGFEGYYQVSNLGRIKSCSRGTYHPSNKCMHILKEKIMKQSNVRGYLQISFKIKDKYENKNSMIKVHRLVAFAFIENCQNKPCVNHINGVKTDNRVENLEWVTYSENSLHAFKTGLKNQNGEKHPSNKLKDSDVIEIKNRIKNGEKDCDIARLFCVTRGNIYCIKKNKTWTHIIID
jgi:hypothetical protein